MYNSTCVLAANKYYEEEEARKQAQILERANKKVQAAEQQKQKALEKEEAAVQRASARQLRAEQNTQDKADKRAARLIRQQQKVQEVVTTKSVKATSPKRKAPVQRKAKVIVPKSALVVSEPTETTLRRRARKLPQRYKE